MIPGIVTSQEYSLRLLQWQLSFPVLVNVCVGNSDVRWHELRHERKDSTADTALLNVYGVFIRVVF
jgi:hypothetical protein